VSPSWVTFLFEAANFLLLAALLGWIFFRPVRDALERRRAALASQESELAARRAALERERSEAEAQRSESEASLSSLRERVRRGAERERQQLLDSAREQAQREREALKTELAALRRGQTASLARDAAAAAADAVERLLRRIDGPELGRALLEAARRELAELAGSGPVAPLVVESAAPLAPEDLAALAGAAGLAPEDLAQHVVPELGTGLRIVTARGLVDASAAGLASHAERALAARIEAEELQRG
jgi:F-type H+-transporting ATPase subunit b